MPRILFFHVLMIGLAANSYAATWVVNSEGTGDAPTIQAAFDTAGAGDLILVEPDIYHEGDIVATPWVDLRSMSGPEATIIDAEGFEYGVRSVDAHAPRLMDGFTIRNASDAGIHLQGGGETWLQSCIIHGCGAGIYARSFDGVIFGCSVVHNQGQPHSGSGFSFSNSSPVIRNSISAFNVGCGVIVWAGDSPTFECCDFYHNSFGNFCQTPNQLGQNDNIGLDPLFCGDFDFTLQDESPCAPGTPPNEGCGLIGALDVGCQASSTSAFDRVVPNLMMTVGPNPMRSRTRIRLNAPAAGPVTLSILDSSGRTVRESRERIDRGQHDFFWDARNDRGLEVPAGVYFVRARTKGGSARQTLVVLR